MSTCTHKSQNRINFLDYLLRQRNYCCSQPSSNIPQLNSLDELPDGLSRLAVSILEKNRWNEVYENYVSDQAPILDLSNLLAAHIADRNNVHVVTKAQVGLGRVNNTNDSEKPISLLTQAALNTKIGIEQLENHTNNNNNPHNVTAAQLNLGNVDNTSDLLKPISTATQFALNSLNANKQAVLIPGVNIKTINGASILGQGDIVVNVNASKLQTPSLSLSVGSSTQIDLSWSSVPNAFVYQLERSTQSNFANAVILTRVFEGQPLSYSDTSLSQQTTYYYRLKAQGFDYASSNYGTAMGTTSDQGVQPINAKIFVSDTPNITLNQINAGSNYSYTSGSNIIGDYRSYTEPKYLCMAELSTEPLKTKWDGDEAGSLNQGNIGGNTGETDNLFANPAIIGSWRVYITEYPTQNNQFPIEFKIS